MLDLFSLADFYSMLNFDFSLRRYACYVYENPVTRLDLSLNHMCLFDEIFILYEENESLRVANGLGE